MPVHDVCIVHSLRFTGGWPQISWTGQWPVHVVCISWTVGNLPLIHFHIFPWHDLHTMWLSPFQGLRAVMTVFTLSSTSRNAKMRPAVQCMVELCSPFLEQRKVPRNAGGYLPLQSSWGELVELRLKFTISPNHSEKGDVCWMTHKALIGWCSSRVSLGEKKIGSVLDQSLSIV